MGLKDNKLYQAAYWKAFEDFFGKQNSAVVKAMMLAKNPKADTGTSELDRVCFGLRQTMGWLAEAIEKKALSSLGHRRLGDERPKRSRDVTGCKPARPPDP